MNHFQILVLRVPSETPLTSPASTEARIFMCLLFFKHLQLVHVVQTLVQIHANRIELIELDSLVQLLVMGQLLVQAVEVNDAFHQR